MSLLTEVFTDLIFVGAKAFLKGGPSGLNMRPLPETHQDEAAKILHELNQMEKPESDFSYPYEGVLFRVSCMDGVGLKSYSLRRPLEVLNSLDDLGMSKGIVDRLTSVKEGLYIFSGTPGAGKTTSACAFLKDLIKRNSGFAITLEDPPELNLQGIHGDGVCLQCLYPPQKFSEGVFQSLRHGTPDIILLGELREEKAAQEALLASVTGRLIITTIHAGDIQQTIRRLAELCRMRFNNPYAILAEGLGGIIHQRVFHRNGTSLFQFAPLFTESKGDLRVGSKLGPVRTMIRDGALEKLATEMERQQKQLNSVG